jgi:hypothetical protein
MYYGFTTAGTPIQPPDWRVRALRRLLWFLPRANPDHEPLYPRVARWLLEIDEDGQSFREIALDESGVPLFGAPDARNFGFFTDSDATFTRDDLVAADRKEFERLWAIVVPDLSRAKA